MSIRNELFSDLLQKHTLITIELQRLNALLVHYSDAGPSKKVSQIADAIKRLELSRKTISIELDRRIPNANDGTEKQEDSTGSSA